MGDWWLGLSIHECKSDRGSSLGAKFAVTVSASVLIFVAYQIALPVTVGTACAYTFPWVSTTELIAGPTVLTVTMIVSPAVVLHENDADTPLTDVEDPRLTPIERSESDHKPEGGLRRLVQRAARLYDARACWLIPAPTNDTTRRKATAARFRRVPMCPPPH